MLVLATASACSDNALPLPAQFAGTLYLANANDLKDIPGDAVVDFDLPVTGLPASGDIERKFATPSQATGIFSFLSRPGAENDPTAWSISSSLGALQPDGAWLPMLQLSWLTDAGGGDPSGIDAVKQAGGDYSLGIAFTKNSALDVADDGLYYLRIHVTPGSGEYTWEPVDSGS